MKLNARWFPFLVGLVALFQVLSPSRVWVALLVMLGGAWLASFAWARALQRQLRLVREMRFGWAQVGDTLEERFTLVNPSQLPALWIDVLDHSTLPGASGDRARSVDPLTTQQWRVERMCSRRGLYTLGPTVLRTSDPLALYTVTQEYPEKTSLLVMPPVVPLPAIEVSPGGQAGEGRRARPDWFERTVNASNVRPYAQGDYLRDIHWPTTARRDELYVRQFDSTPASDWWIFLDLEARVQVGVDANATHEHAIVLAASLVDQGMRQGRPVGLVACGPELVWQAPRIGTHQRLGLLRSLALLSLGDVPLKDLLERARPRFRRGASLVIITANTAGEWVQSLLPLMQAGQVPTVLLLDPASFGGAGQASPVEAVLSRLGVRHYRIQRQVLDRAEARPGRQGKWEWRVLASGRLLPLNLPQDQMWYALGSRKVEKSRPEAPGSQPHE
jgi:uncharacterized protein (DUF58 family)